MIVVSQPLHPPRPAAFLPYALTDEACGGVMHSARKRHIWRASFCKYCHPLAIRYAPGRDSFCCIGPKTLSWQSIANQPDSRTEDIRDSGPARAMSTRAAFRTNRAQPDPSAPRSDGAYTARPPLLFDQRGYQSDNIRSERGSVLQHLAHREDPRSNR